MSAQALPGFFFLLTTKPRIKTLPQILAVVVRRYVVNMYLVTFLEYTQTHTFYLRRIDTLLELFRVSAGGRTDASYCNVCITVAVIIQQ